jgi:cytochrome P450
VKKLGTQLASKFLAFHAGPRLCVGRDLAMLQMKILISTVVSRFHVEELPGLEVTYMPSVTLPMKNPLLMRVTRV